MSGRRWPALAAIGACLLLAGSLSLYETRHHTAVWRHPARVAICLVIAVVLVGWPRLEPVRRWLRAALLDSPRGAFNAALFVAGAGAFAHLSHQLFQAQPHLDDSVAALFQARLFLHGRIAWPVGAEVREFFKMFGIIAAGGRPGAWCGMYPPGWPALLAVGELFRSPWLVNPVLGGALAVMVSELGRELHDRRVGRLAGLLVVASPFVGVLSATHLSHTSTALFCALAWWAACRLLRTARAGYGWLAGLGIGIALLCRPATAVFLGAVIGLGALAQRKRAVAARRGLLAALVVVVAAGGTLAAFQRLTTGDPLTPGHAVEMRSMATLGFGRVGETGRAHTLAGGLRSTAHRLDALNRHLLGWPVPSLLLVLAPFLLLRARPEDYWLIAALGALLLLFATFWYFEEHFPGRYLFAAVPMLLVLAARGWWVSREFFAGRGRLAPVPGVVAVWGIAFAVIGAAPDYQRSFGPHHGDVESNLSKVVESYGITNALVFMESVGTSAGYDKWNDYYATGFMRNNLTLDGDVVYARSATDKRITRPNDFLIARYPGRSYYLYQFDRGLGRSHLYRYVVRDGRIEARVPVAPHDDLLVGDGAPARSRAVGGG